MRHSVAAGATPHENGNFRALLGTRLGVPTILLVGLNAQLTLWAFSAPGGPSISVFLYLGLGWSCLGAYWLFRLVGALWVDGFQPVLSKWRWWVLPPIAALVTATLLVTDAPFRARFALSRSAMNSVAQEMVRDPTPPYPGRVGLYPVRRVEAFDEGMRFLVTGAGFVDPAGFAYSPQGEPPNIGGEDRYWHLEGPWYQWEESW